jgi:L-lactate utilization protein LutB
MKYGDFGRMLYHAWYMGRIGGTCCGIVFDQLQHAIYETRVVCVMCGRCVAYMVVSQMVAGSHRWLYYL